MQRITPTLALAALLAWPARSSATTIDFEGLNDLESVTTQFSVSLGVTFSNTLVFASGVVIPPNTNNSCGQPQGTLNDFETPAHSGCNAVSDDGGPLRVDFATPISSFGGFFTYFNQLTVEAFDASNALLGSTSSLFAQNFISSGNPPNEQLSLSFAGIRSVVITGDPGGGSFVLDDLAFTLQTTQPPMPAEPSTLYLVALGGAGWLVRRRRKT